eukprot:scaffold21260_cov58-Phaeocystis_antarctica.AAC.2
MDCGSALVPAQSRRFRCPWPSRHGQRDQKPLELKDASHHAAAAQGAVGAGGCGNCCDGGGRRAVKVGARARVKVGGEGEGWLWGRGLGAYESTRILLCHFHPNRRKFVDDGDRGPSTSLARGRVRERGAVGRGGGGAARVARGRHRER